MTQQKAAPGTEFATFVDKQRTDLEELPLVHSTLCLKLREITTGDVLRRSACPVFKEAILYFFYGRPAYRSSQGEEPSAETDFCPVCFVFKPHTISAQISRVFPFDSGASANGMFEPYVTTSARMRFELHGTIESVRRLVSLFFETNGNYYLGLARDLAKKTWTDKAAEAYYKLISHREATKYDDRRSAVECQMRDDVTIRNNVLAVLLPTAFLEDRDIRRKIVKDWLAYPIRYSTHYGSIPSHYYAVIREKLQGFLAEGGYL